LSQAEQNRVFERSGRKSGIRVVLATNVAETSLTVPGIRYVIDPGEARISRYSHRTKLQRLPVEPVSQASANQRQGRCGRIGPGVCLRLYSEDDYRSRPAFTDPEIQRTNLAAVILQMLTLGLGDVEQFPFIDPPDSRMVRDGYKLLEELGAVNTAGALTDIGARMARLPVDPRLARMVLAAAEQGCLQEILVITSALTVQDPRERPPEKQQQADQLHARFRHPRSDFMAWLNLWRYYDEQRQALSQNQLRKLLQREYLSFLRMREWRDIHTQLSIACRQQGLKAHGRPARRGELPGRAHGPAQRPAQQHRPAR
jgi:ATP-dependent helicase HrpA